ncbi:hypothetical protein K435DRAFT_859672 [Dendrothele bispora CBS 962.96]|uniref:Uncharacterized protein n=1 Tax=Dendrothele bispora (strain CBS 962.96) TaxID=1314807 RepID=A0A4S8LZV9_DENBC|nr:hypothetical protein K435DRAFT_859672 [Dendrothele bispora CBS 962.96]
MDYFNLFSREGRPLGIDPIDLFRPSTLPRTSPDSPESLPSASGPVRTPRERSRSTTPYPSRRPSPSTSRRPPSRHPSATPETARRVSTTHSRRRSATPETVGRVPTRRASTTHSRRRSAASETAGRVSVTRSRHQPIASETGGHVPSSRSRRRSVTPETPRRVSRSPSPSSDLSSPTTSSSSDASQSNSSPPPQLVARSVRFNETPTNQDQETTRSSTTPPSSDMPSPSDDENSTDLGRKIPKPPGEVGRPGRGGYSLSTALGWDYKKYRKTYINQLCQDNLDVTVCLGDQLEESVNLVRNEAQKRFPFLASYSDHWATDDFIRGRLKYRKNVVTKEAMAAELAEIRGKINEETRKERSRTVRQAQRNH